MKRYLQLLGDVCYVVCSFPITDVLKAIGALRDRNQRPIIPTIQLPRCVSFVGHCPECGQSLLVRTHLSIDDFPGNVRIEFYEPAVEELLND